MLVAALAVFLAAGYRLPAEGYKAKQLQPHPVGPCRPGRWECGWINRREVHQRMRHEAEESGRLHLLDRFFDAARERRGDEEEHGMPANQCAPCTWRDRRTTFLSLPASLESSLRMPHSLAV